MVELYAIKTFNIHIYILKMSYSVGLSLQGYLYNHTPNLRHDAREVEHLSWQVGHVAVHKDKKWLDDTRVGREAWSEGGQDPIDSSH